jgi:hypothetical protein
MHIFGVEQHDAGLREYHEVALADGFGYRHDILLDLIGIDSPRKERQNFAPHMQRERALCL